MRVSRLKLLYRNCSPLCTQDNQFESANHLGLGSDADYLVTIVSDFFWLGSVTSKLYTQIELILYLEVLAGGAAVASWKGCCIIGGT